MSKMLRNTLLMGAGLVFLMRDQIKELVGEARRGELKLSGEEGKQRIKNFMSTSGKRAVGVVNDMRAKVSEVVDRSPLATKKDLDDMEKRIKREMKK
jgi:polyhydroxyalkanoate synthesis regulator phasin